MEQPKKDPFKELETSLAELEERVDRLRSLYEQYFMGYEKLEPSVPRKDVDRRFLLLRKQQIRNTAQRYRFNVVTQKYGTYVMYWTRTCRQIEEGTYKRHIAKATRRFGADAAPAPKKRAADYEVEVEIGEFDDDMAAALAEVDASTNAYTRADGSGDTVPPGLQSDPPLPIVRAEMPRPNPAPVARARGGAPASSGHAVADGPPALDSETSHSDAAGARTVRHAAVPLGSKPRVLLRRRDADGAPPSTRDVDRAVGPATPAHAFRPATLGARPVRPERPERPEAPAPAALGARPQNREAIGRMPVAAPAAPGAPAPSPTLRRVTTPERPASPGRPPDAGEMGLPLVFARTPPSTEGRAAAPAPPPAPAARPHTPAARPLGPPPPSVNRQPVSPPAQQRPGPPATSAPRIPGATSTPRIPGATSTPRIPGATSTPRIPGATSTPRIPGATSTPRIPGATPPTSGGSDPDAEPPRSRRPPPPLPSEASKKKT